MQNTFNTRTIAVLIAGALLPVASNAWAQAEAGEIVPTEVEVTDQVAQPEDSGWKYRLTLGASLSFATSQDVVGNTDGSTWTVGASLDAGANYDGNGHEWRNALRLTEAFTRTPLIDEFVKSADRVSLLSIYFYHLPSTPWFGPYARLNAETAIFAGQDVRSDDVTYAVTLKDGDVVTVTQDRLDMTNPFNPFIVRESAGFFLRPVSEPEINYEFLAGFGAIHTFADGQLGLNDDEETDEIEVIELETFHQAGAAAMTTLWGEFEEGRVSYELGGEVLFPFINDDDQERDAIELADVQLFAGMSFKLVDWASLDYRFEATRRPQLVDVWQLQHSLLLSFNYAFIEEIDPIAE